MLSTLRLNWPSNTSDKSIGIALPACLAVLLGCHALKEDHLAFVMPVQCAVFLLIGWIVLHKPYWGIVIAAAALPISELFSNLASQPVILFGALMIPLAAGIALIHKESIRKFRFSTVHIAALCFVGWVFVSHPQAALARDGNYSIWHLLPLLFLMLASSVLLNTSKKQLLLVRSFVLTSIVSAGVALTHYRIGPTSAESIRASGLTSHPIIASILFLVAMIFVIYDVRDVRDVRDLRAPLGRAYHLWGMASVAILVAGIVATVSRTTFVALPLVFGLAYLLSSNEHNIEQLRRLSVSIIPIALVLALQQNYIVLLLGIPESISRGADSIGFRYLQWQNCWEMFLANPISGVGIGRFIETVPFFGQAAFPQYGINYGPHSIYMSLLAETGTVGFLLYVGMIVAVVQSLWKSSRSPDSLGLTLLLALAIFLFTGLTGDLQFNKLLWIVIGISGSRVVDS